MIKDFYKDYLLIEEDNEIRLCKLENDSIKLIEIISYGFYASDHKPMFQFAPKEKQFQSDVPPFLVISCFLPEDSAKYFIINIKDFFSNRYYLPIESKIKNILWIEDIIFDEKFNKYGIFIIKFLSGYYFYYIENVKSIDENIKTPIYKAKIITKFYDIKDDFFRTKDNYDKFWIYEIREADEMIDVGGMSEEEINDAINKAKQNPSFVFSLIEEISGKYIHVSNPCEINKNWVIVENEEKKQGVFDIEKRELIIPCEYYGFSQTKNEKIPFLFKHLEDEMQLCYRAGVVGSACISQYEIFEETIDLSNQELSEEELLDIWNNLIKEDVIIVKTKENKNYKFNKKEIKKLIEDELKNL